MQQIVVSTSVLRCSVGFHIVFLEHSRDRISSLHNYAMADSQTPGVQIEPYSQPGLFKTPTPVTITDKDVL